jgi:[CysO sulfur-carrier protein]-S-L-cysteine hydrolase
VHIGRTLLDELIAHAREDPKIECCGVVAIEVDGGGAKTATHVFRADNMHASEYRFQIEPKEQMKINDTIDERGWQFGAIYHSHVRSEPKPSQTDINYAAGMPGIEWIIVGLADGEAPEVRSYLIEGGEVREVPLEVR